MEAHVTQISMPEMNLVVDQQNDIFQPIQKKKARPRCTCAQLSLNKAAEEISV